ncbi:MAG TPA: electron transfer flavoprotein subunit beta/FixA family protein [Gemmatimonadaceae bacterium]|nr:electron transfer flavoprotein subunit beta/FixA family protein [Gemmatimonadaceae bacterium]
MKIAVCIKRVPDMEQRFRIAGSGTSVDETGLKYTMSDFDEWAVEAALQLNEKHGGGEITVVSLGPDAVQETIRKALAMGADRGVQLKTEAVPVDGLAIARALAAELRDGGYDLILFGKLAVDTSSGVTGAMVAELLDLPCVTAVAKLDVENGRGRAERALEGGVEVVEFPLPAVVTVDQGLVAQARYPALKGIMAAKKKPLEVKPAQLGQPGVTVTKMELPPERAPGRIIGEGAAAVPELVRLLQEEAKVL